MGRARNGRGTSRGKGKGDSGETSQYITRVDLYKFLCKWELRSYPDDRGRPLFDPAARLSLEHLRTILDGDCSELLRRPPMGLNLASASLDSAALFAPKLAEFLPRVQTMLDKEALNEAIRYFNLNRDVERDSNASKEMCKTYFKQLHKAMRDNGSLLADAAEAAAALYTGLVAFLELAAVSEDVRWWASKVPDIKKQSKHLQAWLNHPKDEEKLFEALAHGIKSDEKKTIRRDRNFGHLDSAVAEASSSVPASRSSSKSSSSCNSSSPDAKKSKKKAKKTSKKAKASKHKKHGQKEKKRPAKSAKASRKAPRKQKDEESEPSSRPEMTPKKKMKGSDASSESKSEQAAPAAATAAPLRDVWPLADIQGFEDKAQELVSAAEGAALAVDQKLALLKSVPVDVQSLVLERAGLRSTAADEVLKANAEQIHKHIFDIVREARLAWIQAAVREDGAKGKSNVAVLPEEDVFQRLHVSCLPESDRDKWTELQTDAELRRETRSKIPLPVTLVRESRSPTREIVQQRGKSRSLTETRFPQKSRSPVTPVGESRSRASSSFSVKGGMPPCESEEIPLQRPVQGV